MARRSVLLGKASASTRIVGSRFCPDCQALREFVARSGIPNEWLDPDTDPAVETLLAAVRHRPRRAARRHHLRARSCGAPRPARWLSTWASPCRACPTAASTSSSSAAAPPGWPPRCTAPPRSCPRLRPREVRRRWPSRDRGSAHRELSGVPHRDFGRRPDPAGDDPGREVRGLPDRALRGHINSISFCTSP